MLFIPNPIIAIKILFTDRELNTQKNNIINCTTIGVPRITTTKNFARLFNNFSFPVLSQKFLIKAIKKPKKIPIKTAKKVTTNVFFSPFNIYNYRASFIKFKYNACFNSKTISITLYIFLLFHQVRRFFLFQLKYYLFHQANLDYLYLSQLHILRLCKHYLT